MLFQGTFKRQNKKANEKIQDGPKHNNVDHHSHDNTGPVQMLTVNGVDYFVRKADGDFCHDARLNQFNNKTVDIDGSFVGPILIINSITKVGP